MMGDLGLQVVDLGAGDICGLAMRYLWPGDDGSGA